MPERNYADKKKEPCDVAKELQGIVGSEYDIYARVTIPGASPSTTRLAWATSHGAFYSAINLGRTTFLGFFPAEQVEELSGPDGSWWEKTYVRVPRSAS